MGTPIHGARQPVALSPCQASVQYAAGAGQQQRARLGHPQRPFTHALRRLGCFCLCGSHQLFFLAMSV